MSPWLVLVALAADAAAPDPWSWSLSTVIAASAFVVVVVAHSTAALVFFFKWTTSLQLVRQDLDLFKGEIRSDLAEIRDTLKVLSSHHAEIAVLQTQLGEVRDRVRTLEVTRGGREGRR